MKEGTHLTVFAKLERPAGPVFDYAAFTVIAGTRHSYRFFVDRGGSAMDETGDLLPRFLRHVPPGGDVLTLVSLPMSPGSTRKVAIASAQTAMPVLEIPPGRFGKLQILCATEAVLFDEAHGSELGHLIYTTVLDIELQVQYLPERAQLIWLTWLRANPDISEFARCAAIAAWQAWRTLEEARRDQPAF